MNVLITGGAGFIGSHMAEGNADFGDGGRTVSGSIRPRMFDDLPECVEAMEATRRR